MSSATPLRWGLIGASTIAGRFVGPAILRAGHTIAGISSGSPARAAEVAAQLGSPRVFESEAALVGSGVDAVYVSSHNDRHARQAIAAARGGCHVLCEKPLATTVDDARAIVHAARDSGVMLATHHHLRHAPAHRALRRLVEGGELGSVLAARLCHATLLPERWRGWRLEDPSRGAGVSLDLTVHSVDLLRFVLRDDPAVVTAITAAQGLAADGIADASMAVLGFRGGALAQVHDAFTVPHTATTLELLGSAASVLVVHAMQPSRGPEVWLRGEDGPRRVPVEDDDVYVRSVTAFAAAVRGEQPASAVASGEDGLLALRAALAVRESAATGRAVALDMAAVPEVA
jgi:1,5-anhydro-D-fructose reductase (1,5-anhydro-D-mannitol-forming)